MADHAGRDTNQVTTLMAVSSVDGVTPVSLWADPTTHRLLVAATTSLALLTDVTLTSLAQGAVLYYNGTKWVNLNPGSNGQVLTSGGPAANPSWSGAGAGSVTSVSVTTANGFGGTVANSTTTPAITIILQDAGDNTKQASFILSGNTTGTNRTITVPDSNTKLPIASQILTFAGPTAARTITFPDASITVARTDAANTFTGHQTIEGVTSTGATGTGAFVFATSPTLVTPVLGVATATSINGLTITTSTGTFTLTNLKTFTVNNSITLAGTDSTTMTFPSTSATLARTDAGNTFTGHQTIEGVTSTGATGTGKFVFDTSPTLVTPALGVASATTINKVTLTTPATGSTLTIIDGKTLTVNNSITLAGTDTTTMTFPSTSATIARTDAAQTFTGTQTFSQIVTTNNAITASGNAATVPITSRLSTVTNNSAATLTITITTTSAVDGQMVIVRALDFSAVAQTITWVNTENSTVSAPTTSNGSTTLPITVGFMYNAATSKWRCVASA